MAFPRILKDQEWQEKRMRLQWHSKDSQAANTTATKAGETGKRHRITEILVDSDAASIVQVKSASTVLWEFKIAANSLDHIELSGCPIAGALGEAVSVVIVTGTAHANISGFTI